jgi:hypothetical protein
VGKKGRNRIAERGATHRYTVIPSTSTVSGRALEQGSLFVVGEEVGGNNNHKVRINRKGLPNNAAEP